MLPPPVEGWGRDSDTGELLLPSDPADWPEWRWRLQRVRDVTARRVHWVADRLAGPWHHWSPRPLENGAEVIVSTYPHGLVCPGGCDRVMRPGDLSYTIDGGPVDPDDPENLLRYGQTGLCPGCAAEVDLRRLTDLA